MGVAEETITCRKCREEISVEGGSCPHCGTGIRSTGKLAAVAVVGAIIVLTAFSNIGQLWFFALVGVAMIAGPAVLVYDKRQRMQGDGATL